MKVMDWVLGREPRGKSGIAVGKKANGHYGLRARAYAPHLNLTDLAALVKTHPDIAMSEIAKTVSGKSDGLRYAVIRAALMPETLRWTCDGCGVSPLMIEDDYIGWTKDGDKDYCDTCSAEREALPERDV